MSNASTTANLPKKSSGLVFLVFASLALNFSLAAWLLRPSYSPPASPLEASKATAADRSADVIVTGAVPDPSGEPFPDNSVPAVFDWNQVESVDDRQFIANLRAAGCPEQIIEDIVSTRLMRRFAQRAQEIRKGPSSQAYWQKPSRNERPTPNQIKALAALQKEHSAAYQELLGMPLDHQRLVDTLYLQLQGSEHELLFLDPDKRELAMKALADPDFQAIQMEAQMNYDEKSRRKLFDEKMKLLADILSPEEMEELRLRGSGAAQNMRNELQYFDCTREEFKRLLELREQSGTTQVGTDLLNRKAATDQIRELLGDERAKEFERVTDMFYQNARRATENFGLPAERADQAWQIANETRVAANAIAKNKSLPVADQKKQLQDLRLQAETRLVEVLGPKAALGVTRDLRVVLQSTEMGMGR